jgi:hypothetical protein
MMTLRGPLDNCDVAFILDLPVVARGREEIDVFVRCNGLRWKPSSMLFGGYYASPGGDCYYPDTEG